MIYTVEMDTGTAPEALRNLKKYRKGVEFENHIMSGIIPEGYMTGDEFERNVKAGLRQKLKEHGYLE
jgi:cyclophilin family peptidyl-prolyl cis-trans isomerase